MSFCRLIWEIIKHYKLHVVRIVPKNQSTETADGSCIYETTLNPH